MMDSDLNRTASRWTYQRLSHPMGIEASDWYGQHSPALSTHFHEEPQISVVVSGRRMFEIGKHKIELKAGSFVIIPAKIPHKAVGKGSMKTASKDVFFDADLLPRKCTSRVVLGTLDRLRVQNTDDLVDKLFEKLSRHDFDDDSFQVPEVPDEIFKALTTSAMSVAEIANQSSYSREGFIRKFARHIGMTPHAFRLVHRAGQARGLLRSDMSPAAAAYEAGFADQSHLGRIFRRSFGTTPAAFRRIWR